MPVPPSGDWRAVLDEVGDARVIVVIGASDAGKTTLVTRLAGELASRGGPLAVVDADVGQSEIGPPTTVGLGRVTGPLDRLSDATLVALQFVGVSSPARDIRGVVDATRRMAERARAEGLDRVLVDTSGLVAGWPGRLLKERKIAAVDPDLLLVLERADECAPIVSRYAGAPRPRVVRVAAGGRPRSRSPSLRRAHRMAALDRYLAGAGAVTIPRSGVVVHTPAGAAVEACTDALCGLDDGRGDTLALGVLAAASGATLRILAPLPRAAVARVASVRVGRERGDGTLVAPAPARPVSTRADDGRDGVR
jgi:polynucleotide 5'-kinase involved in rRNA processing